MSDYVKRNPKTLQPQRRELIFWFLNKDYMAKILSNIAN